MKTEKIAETLRDALRIPVYPERAPRLEMCAVYKLLPAENDGVRETVKIRVRVFAPSYLRVCELTDRIAAAFLRDGEEPAELHYSRTGETQSGRFAGWWFMETRYMCVGRSQ